MKGKIQTIKSEKVYDEDITLNVGANVISFSLPDDFNQSLGCVMKRAWPHSDWTNAYITKVFDFTFDGTGQYEIYSATNQIFSITIYLNYIAIA